MAESLLDRILRHRLLLPALLLVIAGVAVLMPATLSTDKSTRLTTHSVDASGARGYYETLVKLGYDVERLESALTDTLDRNATYILLAPSTELAGSEARRLLQAVREGANLLYVPTGDTPLLDSLGLDLTAGFRYAVDHQAGLLGEIPAVAGSCPPQIGLIVGGLDMTYNVMRIPTASEATMDTVTFAVARSPQATRAVAMGFTLGRGRVAAVTVPDMFRNDIVRRCMRREGELAVRIAAWLTEDPGRKVIFDEYHYGYGDRTTVMRILRDALVETPPGRVALQWVLAAIVLMIAVGARPIPPRPRERIERRSPFEHVGALARAYENIGATRRGAHLLVRGLRRRHDAASWRRGRDDEYLRTLARANPRLRSDVDLLLRAMNEKTTPADFINVGKAVQRIERTLSSEYN